MAVSSDAGITPTFKRYFFEERTAARFKFGKDLLMTYRVCLEFSFSGKNLQLTLVETSLFKLCNLKSHLHFHYMHFHIFCSIFSIILFLLQLFLSYKTEI